MPEVIPPGEKAPEIAYTFTPPFPGAHLNGVPQRDLTQYDVDNMTGQAKQDAFVPHPAYGVPLYTAVHADHVEFQDALADAALVAADGLPELVAVPDVLTAEAHPETVVVENELPKWFLDKIDHAPAGTVLPTPLPKETQKSYEERVARFAPPASDDKDGDE